jgi:hypothetical protein
MTTVTLTHDEWEKILACVQIGISYDEDGCAYAIDERRTAEDRATMEVVDKFKAQLGYEDPLGSPNEASYRALQILRGIKED